MSGDGTTGYASLRVTERGPVLEVLIDHPPMNLLDQTMRADLDHLSRRLADDLSTKVVVIRSADEDFFIAHVDVTGVIGRRVSAYRRAGVLGQFHTMVERWRTLPQVTVAELRGAARGGGLEFLLSLDLVYADADRAVIGLPEVALGIIPAGGGTQRLARATSRGRALEMILTSNDYTAREAERWGIVTRALPGDLLSSHVASVVERISAWPTEALRLAKQAVDAATPSPTDGLLHEYHYFNLSLRSAGTDERLRRFLARGGQQRATEVALGENLPTLLAD